MLRALLGLLLLIGALSPARADQFRPAYLAIRETGKDAYEVLWKVPALDERRALAVHPVWPENVRRTSAPVSFFIGGAMAQRWRIAVPGGIEGKAIRFDGLARTGSDVLVRYQRADGTEQVQRILPVDPSFTPVASPGPFEVIATYTKIGIEHILMGVDHLLFVLALVLIVTGLKRLLLTVTAFTLAHSITLALATLGVVHVPGPPVEATIALSIVFVAVEILHKRQGRVGLAARKPWVVAFCFGLLHGLGFAGALAEVGLPANAIPLALLFFNVGVEIGQLLFIAAVLAIMLALARVVVESRHRALATTMVTYVIGSVASYWLFERVAAFSG